MKKLLYLFPFLFFAFSCKKDKTVEREQSSANGTYTVSVVYHESPYRNGPGDTLIADVDSVYVGNIVISGYEDTIQVLGTPATIFGVQHFNGPLVLRSNSTDTLVYKQTYPAPTGAGYGLDEKTLYFDKQNHKIYYFIQYQSGHDGYYSFKASQQ